MESEKLLIQYCLERLSENYGEKATLIDRSYIGGGCINNALMLNCNVGRFFMKWNVSCANDLFLREAESLREMYAVENSYLVIPKVIIAKEQDEMPGVLLMEYLVPVVGTTEMDEKLGRGLAILHQKTVDQYGFYNDNYCGATVQKNDWNDDWLSFWGEQRICYLLQMIKQARGLNSADCHLFDKFIDRLPYILLHETKPSLIHGDLWSGNYMYTSKGPALIDPACSYSDREMELSMMTMFGGFAPRVWETYQEMFPLSDGWQERNQLYQVYHILNHYYLFGGSYLAQAIRIVKRYV